MWKDRLKTWYEENNTEDSKVFGFKQPFEDGKENPVSQQKQDNYIPLTCTKSGVVGGLMREHHLPLEPHTQKVHYGTQLQTGKTCSQQIKVLHLIMPYSKGGTEK